MATDVFPGPPSDIDDLSVMADWVEICAFVEPSGGVSVSEVGDFLHDAGVLGGRPEDLFTDDGESIDATAFSDQDSVERLVEDVWQKLHDRRDLLEEVYPFNVTAYRVDRVEGRNSLCYRVLLLADAWRAKDLGSIAEQPFPQLFEKIVEASLRGTLNGSAVRFGVPREEGWPPAIGERIAVLADKMSLVAENLDGKVEATDGDRGLDVVARLGFFDDGPGSLLVLAQCATGLHWKTKTGEPSLERWRDILRWEGVLQRLVAVPWHLEPKEKAREYRRFEAVIVDRFRLLFGQPDRFLEESVRKELQTWWELKSKELVS